MTLNSSIKGQNLALWALMNISSCRWQVWLNVCFWPSMAVFGDTDWIIDAYPRQGADAWDVNEKQPCSVLHSLKFLSELWLFWVVCICCVCSSSADRTSSNFNDGAVESLNPASFQLLISGCLSRRIYHQSVGVFTTGSHARTAGWQPVI